MSISNINQSRINLVHAGQQMKTPATDMASSVGQTFSQILENLEKTETESNNLLQQLSAGEDVDLHQLMIATEQTDIAFKVAMGIRDRLVEAYKEVSRMTV